jgi:hypothetical protein
MIFGVPWWLLALAWLVIAAVGWAVVYGGTHDDA